MKKYHLRIELLSDLCVSDGGVYNSTLDTDICHDRCGFPYIPAKRIKGCLRECALELKDWGMDISPEGIFGDKGDARNSSRVRIGDAMPESWGLTYEEMLCQVKGNAQHPIFHPQNILNLFSYVRTQTSVDYDTGVADPHSLRTLRVANKGLVFISEVELEDDINPDAFRACCDTLTCMGIGRTRGLGEVRTTLEEANECTAKPRHSEFVPGSDRLTYTLKLEEPVICKSVSGGETRSLDYIEGSKILGLIAQELNRQGKDFPAFSEEGNLFFSNAYPEKDGEIFREVPADFYSIKNDRKKYLEMGRPDDVPVKAQANQMKHCYVRKDDKGSLVRVEVEMEERYHHSRPEDKSIGRAEGSDDSQFYQLSSIASGQTFCGYVTGTEDQIKTVYDCLSCLDTVFLGYSHSAEYGKTEICVVNTDKSEQKKEKTVKDFSVKLESPALIYNEKAFYSTDVADLDLEIRTALGLETLSTDEFTMDRYVNYTTVGGYNVTWNRRKPITAVFDKGTVLHYHLDRPMQISAAPTILVGERIIEGYGEATVMIHEENWNTQIREMDDSTEKKVPTRIQAGPETLADKICEKMFDDFVGICATKAARSLNYRDSARATISNMLMMCRDPKNTSLGDIRADVEDRYGDKSGKNKDNKHKTADVILEKVKNECGALPAEFCEQYQVEWKPKKNFEITYLNAYLVQLKYNIRGMEQNETEGGEPA